MATEAQSPGDEEAVDKARERASFRRRFFRILSWGVVCLLALFGFSNLWLWSSWGTGMVEAELEKRSGQDWEIESISWSPWNGISLYDTRVLQPDEHGAMEQPLMSVERIRVRPRWLKLVRGQIRLRSVEMESPAITVSVEMLSALASRTVHPKKTKPVPTQPQVNPDPPQEEPKVKPDPQEEKKPEEPKQKPQPPAPQPKVVEKKRLPAGQPVHLKITNASFNLVSIAKKIELISVDGLDYEHTLLGEDSHGEIGISSLQVLDVLQIDDIKQELVWKRPYLEFEEQVIELGEIKASARAQVGIGKNGTGRFPFLMSFDIDRQKLESSQLLEQSGTTISAGAVLARLRVNGLLPQPDTWRADGMLAAENLVIDDLKLIHDASFDEVYLPFVLRQGVLQWARARVISEDISIMGNGMVSMRDGHLSVTRLVVSPEVASMLAGGMRNMGIIDDRDFWWYDLETPDRKVRDLVIYGPLLEPEIDAGSGHTAVPLYLMIDAFYDSLKGEGSEAGLGNKPAPIPSAATN